MTSVSSSLYHDTVSSTTVTELRVNLEQLSHRDSNHKTNLQGPSTRISITAAIFASGIALIKLLIS